MSRSARMACTLAVAVVAALELRDGKTSAQAGVSPTNDLPNPYQTIANHFKMPDGRTWGSTSAVEIDRDGRSIWVAERCGANSCLDFVAEGHGGGNARILKFSKDGKFITAFGKKGSGPGEFEQPHALAMDSKGRLFVGDRSNNRIQILDQNGKFIDQWAQFSRPSGIYIDKQDNIYVADSESESVSQNHNGWKRGIRIGSVRDGKVIAFIPDPDTRSRPDFTGTSAAEGVAVDAQGNIYGAEVGPRALKKYVRGSGTGS